ncbi:MAG: DUF721 domain-containing protein [Candidatus Eremiobacteraeota bacterium]|nr:DUF721 domain-containing protein [Candidatus Eremiobacteraeota bacterium]
MQARLNRDDVLAHVSVAWPATVGTGVAARSRPLKFNAGTLVVLTASSAWSDELSLLAPRILEGLHRSCPQAGVRQLRFRVASGRSKALLDGLTRRRSESGADPHPTARPQTATPPGHGSTEKRPSDTAVERVAHIRDRQHDLDSERDRMGWRRCEHCGRRFLMLATESACAPCSEQVRRSLDARVERALMQAPWLRFEQLAEHVPETTQRVAERVRRRLLTRWQAELDVAQRRLRRGAVTPHDRVIAWGYVMLLAGLPQSALGPAVVSDVLGSDWAAVLCHDQRSSTREAARAGRPNKTR